MSDDPIISALARLEAGQATMSDRLARLEQGQTQLRGDLMERMDRLQDAITDIHADIAVNFGAVDQARKVNDNTREDMRGLNDLVARMMTLLLRLQTEVAELKGRDK